MNTLGSVFLISSIALGVINTYAQNAAGNSNNANAGQAPTIEDRLAQLEQDQQGLTGRVDTLNQEVASLQQEIKRLEGQSSESNGHSSKAATGAGSEMPATTNEVSAAETNGTAGASYDLFYDRLQSDGQWFNDATYGSVWQPKVAFTDQQWRPYTDGRWAYTDRGWTWISNEDFGWATYHYGRWVRLSQRGWVWVPGSTWAPAWVSWRQSDDYVGWAPLPPETESEQDVKIEGWADTYYNIGPGSYVFLKTIDLANQSYRGFIASPQDDLDIISRTRNVTNIYYAKTGVIDNGPDYDRLVRDPNVKIDRYRLNYVQQNNPEAQFSATTHGNQLQVVAPAPRLQRAATVEPKIAGTIANAQVDRGWQNIDEAGAKQLKQTWEKQAPVPASLPATPVPPKPFFARAAGQNQGARPQPATENREPNPPSATQQPDRRPNDETIVAPTASPSPNEKTAQPGQQPSNTNRNQRQEVKPGERQESMPPAPKPSPTPNEKAAGQPPEPNENRRQEANQAQRPETTPPAPSPSENERSARPSERREASPQENRRREQGEGEGAQPAPRRVESSQPANGRPEQSEEKRKGGEKLDQEAPGAAGGTDEKGGLPQKEEKTSRQLKNGEQTPSRSEGPQRQDDLKPRKSNVEEGERPASGEKKGQSRDQSGSEKPGGTKRSDEPEKKKVGPSEEQ